MFRSAVVGVLNPNEHPPKLFRSLLDQDFTREGIHQQPAFRSISYQPSEACPVI